MGVCRQVCSVVSAGSEACYVRTPYDDKSAKEIAALFSTGRDDAPSLAAHMMNENKELHRRIRLLEEIAAGVEAHELFASVPPQTNGVRVIAKVFDGRDIDNLKKLAHSLTANGQVIALLGSREKDTARLVFARSSDLATDMNALMKTACALLDGKGGGKPEIAQGGGKNVEKLDEAINAAANEVMNLLGVR